MKSLSRTKAREYALQALYQWQMAQTPLAEIETWFLEEFEFGTVDFPYFRELLYQITAQIDTIDDTFKSYLDRDMSALNGVELTVLRIGTYELLHRLDIPYKVSINEGIKLTKLFGTVTGYQYVNGVLDKVAQATRSLEIQAKA